jgi:surface antigen
MKSCCLSLVTCLLLLVLTAGAAQARTVASWSFLRGSVYADLAPEDWEMLRSTGRDLLDNHSDGSSKSWRNEATQASGEISVLETLEQDGRTCRWLSFRTSRGDNSSPTGKYLLCQVKDGSWKFSTVGK